jgi:putative MATE family efflux protein
LSTSYNTTEGSILRKLLAIAIPVLLTSISQMAYNLTDMFWLGQVDTIGLSESETIAGVGTAGYITWFAFGLILIGRIGTSVKVSHAVGEKNPAKITKYASNGLFILIAFGIIFSGSVLIFQHQILGLFQITNPQVIQYALDYLRIVGGLLVIQFAISGFAAMNEGLGKTKKNFLVLVIGLALNIALDPLFILVFQWGVSGAALATILSQGISLLVFIGLHVFAKEKVLKISLKAIDSSAMREIIRIGVPSGVQSMIFTSISIYLARMVYVYGENVMTAQRIGTQIEQFTWMIGGGFQTALGVFVGQNYGAKQFARIKKGTILLSSILIPYAIFIALLLLFEAEWLMRLFVDDERIIAHGKVYLQIISLAQIFMMMEAIGSGLFNGIGKTKVPSVIGIVGNALRIPLAIVLVSSFQEQGIWWSLNISDIGKGTALVIASLWMIPRLETWYQKDQARKQVLRPTL